MPPIDRTAIDARFDDRLVEDTSTQAKLMAVKAAIKNAAYYIADVCPEGRQKRIALARLEDVQTHATKSILGFE